MAINTRTNNANRGVNTGLLFIICVALGAIALLAIIPASLAYLNSASHQSHSAAWISADWNDNTFEGENGGSLRITSELIEHKGSKWCYFTASFRIFGLNFDFDEDYYHNGDCSDSGKTLSFIEKLREWITDNVGDHFRPVARELLQIAEKYYLP